MDPASVAALAAAALGRLPDSTKQQLLQAVPGGALDPAVVLAVIDAVCQSLGVLATFARKGGLGNTFSNLVTISGGPTADSCRWMILLDSLPSWAGASTIAALKAKDPSLARFKDRAAQEIAAWLGVGRDRVGVSDIPDSGNPKISFTVAGLTPEETSAAVSGKGLETLRSKFNTLVEVKVPPPLRKLEFDLDELDPRGNKDYTSGTARTYKIGPKGAEAEYTQPQGWYRYGLKVKGKYADGDAWLEPFGGGGNWYRAYHGTGRSHAGEKAAKSIYKDGFIPSGHGCYGPGVYVSPKASFSERGYCGVASVNTGRGTRTFKFILQVAVHPGSVTMHTENIWTVPSKKEVRPYGILIKEE